MTLVGAVLIGSLVAVGVVGAKMLRRAGRSRVEALKGACLLVSAALGAWVLTALVGGRWIGSFDVAAAYAAWTMPFVIAAALWILSRER